MRLRIALSPIALLVCLLVTLSVGCAHPPTAQVATAPMLQGDPAHPGSTQGWVDTRLYFGLGLADHSDQGISEQEWRAFLDKEVTPRFPSGLSVLDVYGQWQGKTETAPERLRSKMLIIYYPGFRGEPRQDRRHSHGMEAKNRRPVSARGNRARRRFLLTVAFAFANRLEIDAQ